MATLSPPPSGDLRMSVSPGISRRSSLSTRISTYLYKRPTAILLLLLGPPMAWMFIIYLGSLFALLVNSFFSLDGYTGLVVRQFTLSTYGELFTRANSDIVQRTAGMAAAGTVNAAILAFPLALFTLHFASRRIRGILYLAVLLPLW